MKTAKQKVNSLTVPCSYKEAIAPTIGIIDSYLESSHVTDRTATHLMNLVAYSFDKDSPPNNENFDRFSGVCNAVMVLLTNPNISGVLPEGMHDSIGEDLKGMADFFSKLTTSNVCQSEMYKAYLQQHCKSDKMIIGINQWCQEEIA